MDSTDVVTRSVPFRFETRGVATAATLWLPGDSTAPVPVVVTGPGFGGVKEMLIPHYARALAEAGIATLAFDPVGFGESGGARRQHVDPREQIASFAAAIDALEADDRVDSARLGVFGTSLSGGHAMVTAARDSRVRCAVVIVPFIRLGGKQSPALAWLTTTEVVRRWFRRPDRFLGLAGAPGDRAAMTTDGAEKWLTEIAVGAENFRNEVTVSSLFNLFRYSTARAAKRLTVPTLAIIAEHDSITPGSMVRRALPAEYTVERVFQETHFELFTEHLEATVEATAEWFSRHLLG